MDIKVRNLIFDLLFEDVCIFFLRCCYICVIWEALLNLLSQFVFPYFSLMKFFEGSIVKPAVLQLWLSIIQWMKCCYFTICWTIGDVHGIMAILYYRYFLGELLATWNSNNLFPVDGGACIGMWFLSSEFVCWSFLLKVQAVLNHVILLLIFYS